MPCLKDYRIFISHAWRYGDEYKRLTELLDKAPLFSYYNYSAPKEKPLFPAGNPHTKKYIAQKITEKIRPAQVVLVIGGMYAAYSDWMQYEIDEAIRMGKPVIGIRPWGQIVMPTYVTNNSDIIVGWNANSIISSIRDFA